jgi:hypothetical protein
VLIRSNGGNDFMALAKRLRQAGPQGKQIRRELTKELQRGLAPVVADVQDSVRGVPVKGARGSGTVARRRFMNAAEMRRLAKARARGRQTRARRGGNLATGLRDSIARGVKGRVQYSGHRYGAQIVAHTSGLPQSQRRLPRHLDSPRGWRHPVFGNREVWVSQYGAPWFAVAIKRHEGHLRRVVTQSVNNTMRKLR